MDSYDTRIQEAVIKTGKKTEENPTITLSTGVVLRLKRVSFMRIQSIVAQFPDPEVPLIEDKERDRVIRNPNAPFYLAQKAEREAERMMAVVDAIAVFGTDIEFVPDDLPKPTENSWIEELEFVNIHVDRESDLARKLNWIKYVAVRDPEDLVRLSSEFNVQMGTAEGQVAAQLRENFPHNEEG